MPAPLKPRAIGVLIFEDFQLLDAAGPIGAFEMPMRGIKPAPYELSIIAPVPGPVRSSSGASMMAGPIPRQPTYDTLIISGGWGTRAAMMDPKVQALVRAAMKNCRRVCSVCSGSYPAPSAACSTTSAPPPIGAGRPISSAASRT